MHRRLWMIAIGLVLSSVPCMAVSDGGDRVGKSPDANGPSPSVPPTERRPNIVVIVSDDHRWDLMGCMGNPYMNTPQFDRLAREGCLFENAFTVCGVCSPSRASILTGQYSHQCGAPYILWTNHTFLNNATPFPARLQAAGYHTAHIGKWHLGNGHLPKPGYDYWAGFEWLGEYNNPKVWINGTEHAFEGFSDDVLSTLAAEYICERANHSQPFCLYLGLKAPHLHFKYPARLAHALEGIDIPKPDSYDEDYDLTGKADCLKGNVIDIETFRGGLPLFGNSWDTYIKSYYRSALSIDDSVGRVLDALDAAGIADDTFAIYTSDQGYTLGEHGMTEKHYAYEQVMRVPMLVRYPRGIEPGVRRQEMVLTIDIAPTLLELAGLSIPADMTGRSWRPLWASERSEQPPWREEFLFEFASQAPKLPAQLAVRTERYKLITYQYHPDRELYDLQKDPREMRNLVDDPQYADVLADMNDRLDRLIEQTGWVKRTEEPVQSCYLLGPVAASDEEQVKQALRAKPFDANAVIRAGDRQWTWRKLETRADSRFDVTNLLGQKAGHIGFIAVPLERRVPRDPHVLVRINPSLPKEPIEAYLAGRADWQGRFTFASCNPPLDERVNTVLVRVKTPVQGNLHIAINAPRDSVVLP